MMNKVKSIFILTFVLLIQGQLLFAKIKIPKLISDGMVLQRDAKVKIWGWADVAEKVSVSFNGMVYETVADDMGNWAVTFSNMDAGGPYEMIIVAKDTITIYNILIGDVWVCSGQSNMELDMERVEPLYEREIKECNYPNIRQFYVPREYYFKNPKEDIIYGEWLEADEFNIHNFSAVAYFFAKELFENNNVPVGLINTSLGGSPIQAWMSEDALKEFPVYYNELLKFKNDSIVSEIDKNNKRKVFNWYDELSKKDSGYINTKRPWFEEELETSNWKKMVIPGYWTNNELEGIYGSVWFRKTINIPWSFNEKDAELLIGRIIDADYVFINGKYIGGTDYQYPPRRYKFPSGILKEGKNTITIRVISNRGTCGFVPDKPYKLKISDETIDLTGEWFYRVGAKMKPLESEDFIRYKAGGLYNAMISPLLNYQIKGVIWYQGESNADKPVEYRELFPAMIKNWRDKWGQGDFPFLYVQLPNFIEAKSNPSESNWARLREAQLNTLKVPNTGMAVTIDIGEWNDVHPQNKKDVGKRLALAAQKIAYEDNNIVYSGPIFNSMQIKGNRVILTFDNIGTGLMSKNGKELNSFAIAGTDKQFVWAKAKIEHNKIIVWNENITDPIAVRYAWADNPEGANLYNKEGLPASPFRTDDWEK